MENEGAIEARDDDGSIVGRLLYGESNYHAGLEIHELAVHPDHRRKGLGSHMHQLAEDHLDASLRASGDRTEEGEAWSKARGIKMEPRYERETRWDPYTDPPEEWGEDWWKGQPITENHVRIAKVDPFPGFKDPYQYTDADQISWRGWTDEERAGSEWMHRNLGPGPTHLDPEHGEILQSYVEGHGMTENQKLRDGQRTEWSDAMDRQFDEGAQPLPHDLVVHRGMGLRDLGVEHESELPSHIVDRAHSSVSLNEGVARFFAGERAGTPALISITVPKGSRHLLNMSSLEDDEERLYPDEALMRAGLPLRVDKVERKKGMWEADDDKEYVHIHTTAEEAAKPRAVAKIQVMSKKFRHPDWTRHLDKDPRASQDGRAELRHGRARGESGRLRWVVAEGPGVGLRELHR